MSLIQKLAKNLRIGGGCCVNGHSLMNSEKTFEGEKAIALKLRLAGREGMIYLNPYLGKFEYECDLELKQGDVVELLCPECGVSLVVDTMCNLCNIPMFAVQLPDGGQVEACLKVGCHNHTLTIVDLDAQLERMYVNETKVQM